MLGDFKSVNRSSMEFTSKFSASSHCLVFRKSSCCSYTIRFSSLSNFTQKVDASGSHKVLIGNISLFDFQFRFKKSLDRVNFLFIAGKEGAHIMYTFLNLPTYYGFLSYSSQIPPLEIALKNVIFCP